MSQELRDFKDALLARRVASTFVVAMEHSSPEEMKKYLHDHPNADPKDHKVQKTKGGKPSATGGDASADASKADARAKDTTKLHDEVKSLKSKVENGNEAAANKMDRAYGKLYDNGEAAAKSAEKLVKKFENVEGEQVEAAVKMIHQALGDWNRNKVNHLKGEKSPAHEKVRQAEQTWGYATKIDDHIKMLSQALKGEFDD